MNQDVYIDESSFRRRYQYKDTDLLGEGGFAQVYKAMDVQFQEPVALKFYNKTEQSKYDVLHEILKGRGFAHKNIIRVHDAFTVKFDSVGTSSFIQVGVLEFANGGNLRDFMRSNPSPASMAEVMKGILSGLQYLHSEKQIIHRDLTPENILMVVEGSTWTPRIADFGISKKLDNTSQPKTKDASTQLLGKVEYMAPEQFSPDKFAINGKISTNVDLWAFGVILYELFLNKKPFAVDDENTMRVIQSICNDPTPDLKGIPQPFRDVANLCLKKDAAKRAQTANELIDVINKGMAGAGTASREAKTVVVNTTTIPKGSGINLKWAGGIAAAVALAGAGVVFGPSIFSSKGETTALTDPIQKVDSPAVIKEPAIESTAGLKEEVKLQPADNTVKKEVTESPKTTSITTSVAKETKPANTVPDNSAQITKLLTEGENYFKNGNTELAVIRFNEVLRLDPNNTQASTRLKEIRNMPPRVETPAGEYYSINISPVNYLKLTGMSILGNQITLLLEVTPAAGDIRLFPPKSKGAFYITYRDNSGNNNRLDLLRVDGIDTSRPVKLNSTTPFKLTFQGTSDKFTTFSLIEGEDQMDETQTYWNFYDIIIKRR